MFGKQEGLVRDAMDRRILRVCLLFFLSSWRVHAFVWTVNTRSRARFNTLKHRRTFTLHTYEEATVADDDVARLRREAERIRLEADKLEMSLTLEKIESLEKKLGDERWLKKNPDQEESLKTQVGVLKDRLNLRLGMGETPALPLEQSAGRISTQSPTPKISSDPSANASEGRFKPFSDDELAVFMPIVTEIEERLHDAPIEERVVAFLQEPVIRKFFGEKLAENVFKPITDIMELERLKAEYLNSNSEVEKSNIKRQIDQVERRIESAKSSSLKDTWASSMAMLTEEETDERVESIKAMPQTLQGLFLRLRQIPLDSGDLRLAVQLDYYEPQLEAMDQIALKGVVSSEEKEKFAKIFDNLPLAVRSHLAKCFEAPENVSADKLLEISQKENGKPKLQLETNVDGVDSAAYDDVEFVDRSRFLEVTFPAIARLETVRPSLKDAEIFAVDVIDKDSFMVSSKPERVLGGYYIRGNVLKEGDGANAHVVESTMERLKTSAIGDKVDFFFVDDPAPLSDEDIERGVDSSPVFVVTSSNLRNFYQLASPTTKVLVSLGGILSTFIYSIGACAMNPVISEKFYKAMDEGYIDIGYMADLVVPCLGAVALIQVLHEMGHYLVSLRDKFEVGFPTVVPALQTGFLGCITPLQSPPPTFKSLFDFAVSGPLVGLLASIGALAYGLDLTATMAYNTDLPVLPVELIQTSTLASEMAEYYLRSGLLSPSVAPDTQVSLHPLAVAGFIGLMSNALALIPIGSKYILALPDDAFDAIILSTLIRFVDTDGGRVALAMFGRTGATVVKGAATLALCCVGLFGLDESNIFLMYVLFSNIWQRDLETPVRNEVDELDIGRGFVGIIAFVLAGLVLIPVT